MSEFYLSFGCHNFISVLDPTILSRILRASESTIRLNVVDSEWMNYFRCLISIDFEGVGGGDKTLKQSSSNVNN